MLNERVAATDIQSVARPCTEVAKHGRNERQTSFPLAGSERSLLCELQVALDVLHFSCSLVCVPQGALTLLNLGASAGVTIWLIRYIMKTFDPVEQARKQAGVVSSNHMNQPRWSHVKCKSRKTCRHAVFTCRQTRKQRRLSSALAAGLYGSSRTGSTRVGMIPLPPLAAECHDHTSEC